MPAAFNNAADGALPSVRRFPDVLTLLLSCLAIAALLTWVLPAGEYARQRDLATGREVVVPGTYHRVPSSPVTPFDAIVAIPRGIAAASSVIALVFLVGAGLTVVDKTGVFKRAVDALIARVGRRDFLIVPIVSLLFVIGGVTEGMSEEVIALVPALLVMTDRLGYPRLTAVAMSLGAAAVGGALSPMNPFQVGIAQKLAGVPLLSGAAFRLALLVPAVVVWIAATMLHARRHAVAPAATGGGTHERLGGRHATVLAMMVAAFAVYVFGVIRLGWEFEQMSAIFLAMGVVAGLIGGLGVPGTIEALVDGFRSMAYAGMLIGFSRAIFVVLEQGRIVDTLVNALLVPVAWLPLGLAAVGMMAAHSVLHVPVPSTTGQAVLSMPILVPLSDLLGLSRQLTVLAYQLGAGLCELITPTNGSLMAVLAAANVGYRDWARFALPVYVVLMLLGAVGLVAGLWLGFR